MIFLACRTTLLRSVASVVAHRDAPRIATLPAWVTDIFEPWTLRGTHHPAATNDPRADRAACASVNGCSPSSAPTRCEAAPAGTECDERRLAEHEVLPPVQAGLQHAAEMARADTAATRASWREGCGGGTVAETTARFVLASAHDRIPREVPDVVRVGWTDDLGALAEEACTRAALLPPKNEDDALASVRSQQRRAPRALVAERYLSVCEVCEVWQVVSDRHARESRAARAALRGCCLLCVA